MVVEVRSIRSRPVRRRGMKPLVEATVADETGLMKATFFNQPWLEKEYRPGTRLVLPGKYEGRNRFRVQQHAPTERGRGDGDDVAEYPATKGITSTQILALVREHSTRRSTRSSRCPARLRAAQRLPDRAGRAAWPRTSASTRRAASASPSRSCCSTSSCSCGCAPRRAEPLAATAARRAGRR